MDLIGVKPACVIDGVPWYSFLFEYDWEGTTYSFAICARTEEEAKARLKRLPLARSLGPCEELWLPDHPLTRWLMPHWLNLVCWWRNLKSKR